MPKRVSEIAQTLKQLGEIQVTDWDFMELLNTEIKDLEISRSLKRLGNKRVMDWDFRTVLPAVKKAANQEVDVVDFFKRTANYKVMDWDFRSALPVEVESGPPQPAKPSVKGLSQDEMQAISLRLKNFLQYVAVNLIDEPSHAQIKVLPLGPNALRFKLVLVKKDVAMLVGREGFTAAAMRSILKAAAAMYGVQALLQIHSHEEEAAFLAKEEARR
jgi:predicted RNA-binding protein YlqC (UPF0109 family)